MSPLIPTTNVQDPTSAPSKPLGQSIIAIVARNSALVLAAQMVIKLIAFVFNVYIVRRLGAVHFGQYAGVMAYVTVFGIFTDLGMSSYSLREMTEDRHCTSWLLPNIIICRTLLSLLVTCIAPLSAYWLGKEPDIVLGILVASGGLILWAVRGPLDSALAAQERFDYIAVFSVVHQLVFWGLGVLFLASGMGFIGLILASLVGVAVTASLSAWSLVGKLGVRRFTFSIWRWPKIWRAALPFGVSSMAGAFLRRFDTLLMSIVLTDAAVGWYNAPYSLIATILLLAQSIATVLYPSMVRGYQIANASLRGIVQRSIRYLLLISLPIAVGGTILADRLVLLLYTDEFASSIPVLRVMLWALPCLFLLELLGRVANVLHLERPASKINVVNAIVTVVLNLILVPTMGVLGGALALVLGRAIRLLQFWLLIGNEQLVGRQWRPILRVVLSAGLMGAVVFLVRELPLAFCIGTGAVGYVALLLALQGVDIQELLLLGRTLVRREGLDGAV